MNRFARAKIETEVLEIGPDLAQEMLGFNVNNRTVKAASVEKFERDMREGNWALNGTPIRFSVNGRLLDGQNRLMACIRSGATFTTLVIYGLPEDSQDTMDGGTIRSLADAFTMRGFENAQALQTTVFTHRQWLSGELKHSMSQPPGSHRATIPEGLAHLNEHPDLETAARSALSLRSRIGIPSIGGLAVAYYECSRINSEDAETFFSRLSNYQTEGKGDPLATLLQRVGLMRQRRERMLPATALFLTFRTWNAFRKKETITQLLLGSEASGWAKIPTPI